MTADPLSTPLVSVIIPVHNAGGYLADCLESVLRQTLAGIEVIVVDDASDDGSLETVRRFAAIDQRVRVIPFSCNRGVSAARNAGLEAARGEFVAFVDADDYVDTSMYEELLTAAREWSCEVVSCGLVVEPLGGPSEVTPFPLPPRSRLEPSELRERLHHAFARRMLWYPVRSLYSRAMLDRHEIRFDPGIRKGEDSLFNLHVLTDADGVACVTSAPYHYRKHPGNATARPLASESMNLENLGRAVLAFYRGRGFDDRARDDFYSHVLRSDLPTALVRLKGHPEARAEVSALIDAQVVRDAFDAIPVRHVSAPVKVKLLLMLAKARALGPIILVLRAGG